MRVINLLPWREYVHRRRQRNFVLSLLMISLLALMAGVLSHASSSRQRHLYDARMTELQGGLVHLQQEWLLLQQHADEFRQISQQLQALQRRWLKQREWQQLFLQWQLLSAAARIENITMKEGDLVLSGNSSDLAPLRQLLHQSPPWDLQQIALDGSTGFHFQVARSLQTQGDH